MLLLEFDNFHIISLSDQIWYILITMTTVGYGDFVSKKFFGKFSMILATFVGAVCSSLYVMGVNNFLKMDIYERYAYTTIQRDHLKRKMKSSAINWIQCLYKANKIKAARGLVSEVIQWRNEARRYAHEY